MPKPFSVLAHKTTLPDVEAQSEIGPLWLSPIDEDNVLVDANKHCLSPKNGDLSAAPNVDCRFVRVVHRGKTTTSPSTSSFEGQRESFVSMPQSTTCTSASAKPDRPLLSILRSM